MVVVLVIHPLLHSADGNLETSSAAAAAVPVAVEVVHCEPVVAAPKDVVAVVKQAATAVAARQSCWTLH